ncbi:hypothetical protein [Streptomyces sp. NPDC004284]|uniref:hypothetical protein n=1 Tax=Streptomyces sp. NPDC004284 TaxID=3364695 RepID=UPI003674D4BB
MATLEKLVEGHYRQAAQLAAATGDASGLALHLLKADPLLIPRDLLAHSSVATAEVCLKRLDVHRTYRAAWERTRAVIGAADPTEGLAATVHPHGPLAKLTTVKSFAHTLRRMVRELAGDGFTGSAAELTRAVLGAFWLRSHYLIEYRTRRSSGPWTPGIRCCRSRCGRWRPARTTRAPPSADRFLPARRPSGTG